MNGGGYKLKEQFLDPPSDSCIIELEIKEWLSRFRVREKVLRTFSSENTLNYTGFSPFVVLSQKHGVASAQVKLEFNYLQSNNLSLDNLKSITFEIMIYNR